MHLRIVAIGDDRVAVLGQRHDARRLADHRNTHGARNDHHMAGHRTVFKHQATHVFTRIIEQLGRPHGARHDDRIVWKIRCRHLGAVAGQLPEQPVGQVVEIMHPLAQIRIRQPDHPRLGFALHPLDSRFRRQAVADRFFKLAHPAAVMREHPVGFQNGAVFAFHGNVAARQHVVDRDAQRSQRFRQPAKLMIGIVVQKVGDDDARLVQHDVAKADTIVEARSVDCHRPRKVEFQSRTGELLQLPGRHHLGKDHGRRFHRFDLVVAIGAARLVLHDENAERAAGAQDRHAKEGMIDFFAGLRQVGEGRMRLRVGEVERPGAGGNGADEALPHLQLRQMHGALVQTLGGVKLQHTVGAQHVDRTHLCDHVLRNLANNLIKAILRLERFRHQFAQPLEEDAWTRREVSHRAMSPE